MFQNSGNQFNATFSGLHQRNFNDFQKHKSAIIPQSIQGLNKRQDIENIQHHLSLNSKRKEPVQSKDRKAKESNRWVVSWTIQEDYKLFEKYVKIGSRWVELTKYFPQKSDNAIKNRFYCCMRKVQRRMNKVQKQKKLKYRKPISYDSLLTIMQIGKYEASTEDKRFINIRQNIENILKLRELIIQIARQPEQYINDEEVEGLIIKFFELKYSLKFINIERVKKSAKPSNEDKNLTSTKEPQIESSGNVQQKQPASTESTAQNFQNNGAVLDDLLQKVQKIPQIFIQAHPKPSLLDSYQQILNVEPQSQNFDDFFVF